jgi:DNA mismatch repair protein MutS
VHFDAAEHRDGIVFLHAVEEGPANRSYGLSVAKLAGVPPETIRKAKAYLSRLDQFSARTDHQGDLFSGPPTANAGEGEPSSGEAIAERLRALDPDAMSPREALEALYALKKMLHQ